MPVAALSYEFLRTPSFVFVVIKFDDTLFPSCYVDVRSPEDEKKLFTFSLTPLWIVPFFDYPPEFY